MIRNPFLLIIFLSLVIAFNSCKKKQETIIVFHAGSLSVPLKQIGEAYEDKNPGVSVQLESTGSLSCVRKITELNKSCDILAVADYALIDELIIPDFSDHNILFAGNELCIGFKKDSRWKDFISNQNWYDLLLRDDVHFGRSDPDHDPSGYRTVILAGLAEKLLGRNGLQDSLMRKDHKFIRPKGTELLPLLETGTIDFVFHYKSVLVQHGLGYISLNDSLNLSKPELNDWYKTVCVDVQGKSKNETIEKCGEAMVYGVCRLKNAPNYDSAEDFLKFVLSEGKEILEQNGQPVLIQKCSQKTEIIPKWFTNKNKDK